MGALDSLEKFLMKAKGTAKGIGRGDLGAGKFADMLHGAEVPGVNGGIGYGAKSARQMRTGDGAINAVKNNPIKTGLGVGAAGMGAAELGGAFDDDDSLEGLLNRGKKKLGGLVDDGEDGLHDLLKRLGIG